MGFSLRGPFWACPTIQANPRITGLVFRVWVLYGRLNEHCKGFFEGIRVLSFFGMP